ncbi:nitrite reductase large subunit NirB [Bacillus canaveralius]|uniref:nitrite reductase large subunit NirB n=1 Tax=Bacillus canaveralius TaxID=1403243 RepID=UPI000F79D754|nr:nitrite reductase large subunit NirB [Bacillus canaveralius]RSK56650.1 NAD(P)/FAD-dependent oxidoreductase [Bacillus canaveralius]
MDKQRLVLIGNGMAGVHCIEEIIKVDANKFEITIIGSEPYGNYNRIMLSSVLQGDTKITEIMLHEEDWYKQKGIKLFIGETVKKLDIDKQIIRTDKGREIPFDQLILATGSTPFILPIPGVEKEGVYTFRTIQDCQKIMEAARRSKKAAVIGGGLLGLEAAKGLQNLGLQVHVIHKSSLLMERQLDATASKMLRKELERQGMKFLLAKETKEIIGDLDAKEILFSDGTKVDAEMIVIAAGVQPNCQLARDSGILTNRGILVNEFMQTNIPNIYAVGECAEHEGVVYGLVKPLYKQGAELAKHICGVPGDGYVGSVLSTQLKISGVNVFSIGKLAEDRHSKAITVFNDVDGIYKKMIFQENRLVGSVLYGDIKEAPRLLDIIRKKKDIASVEKGILLSPAITGEDPIASLKPSEMICNCNGVSKGAIIEAVISKGLSTVEQIKQCTKASGACGSCKPLISELLAYTMSDDFDEFVETSPLCRCTSLTEDEVVCQMQKQNLTSAEEIMAKLGWTSLKGCPKCLPALQYYLRMVYPHREVHEDNLIEMATLNGISHRDGTFSVTPQMYGGVTNPKQLRKIADVMEKYQIAKAALTSEQRIQLIGISREDLEGIKKELDMHLGETNSPLIHTVKTTINESNCGCGKHDSLEIAARLDRITECLQTPYRIRVGVSPCIHGEAGSTSKDIGVIAIDGRWEIYVGGSDERRVRAGDLLYVVASPEEVIELSGAFIQYYRETANYLERTWEWIERVGLIHIREVLFDSYFRGQLLNRLKEDSLNRQIILETR